MKFKIFFSISAVSAAILMAGCIQSHRPVAYGTPTTTVITHTPTSARPATRIYTEAPPPGANAVVVEPAIPGSPANTTPTSADLAIADSIRQMFDADPSLAGRSTNAKVYVSDRVVTLEGSVPSRTDKMELQKRIATIPSVDTVNNRLEVGVPGR